MNRRREPGRVVVDTNLIVSGLILARGQPHELIRAIRRGAFRLVLSDPLYAEYDDVLNRPMLARKYGLAATDVAEFLFLARTLGHRVEPREPLPVHVRDPKDDMVLAAALGGGADYVVSGDQDLLVLDSAPELGALRVVTARAFLAMLANEEGSSG
jgi:putative PIN family toxin of toxin-antitoxin system